MKDISLHICNMFRQAKKILTSFVRSNMTSWMTCLLAYPSQKSKLEGLLEKDDQCISCKSVLQTKKETNQFENASKRNKVDHDLQTSHLVTKIHFNLPTLSPQETNLQRRPGIQVASSKRCQTAFNSMSSSSRFLSGVQN